MTKEKGSAKVVWEGGSRGVFEGKLRKCRWRVVGANLWEKGGMRIEMDNWGLFVFEYVVEGGVGWLRTQGLSDDRICGSMGKGFLVGEFNNGLYLDLELCEFVCVG